MTIRVPDDLARFVEDAVRTGQFASADDVIRDALIRLRQAMAITAAATDQSSEPVFQEKPLTKQRLLNHLADIGLIGESTETSAGQDNAGAPSSDDEEEIISDFVIRERLIEWLAGFLSKD
jgi:Arc/MetJ-type ribon-helix-helix transcriptional regulator